MTDHPQHVLDAVIAGQRAALLYPDSEPFTAQHAQATALASIAISLSDLVQVLRAHNERNTQPVPGAQPEIKEVRTPRGKSGAATPAVPDTLVVDPVIE